MLVEWLQSQGVEVDPRWLRAEVWRLCKARRPEPSYRIDRIFRENGHTVICTPPYHPEFQPIELVWANVKRHIAANQTFKIKDLGDLTERALAQVTPEKCRSYVDKYRATATADAERARLLDKMEEHSLIINFSSDSDESSFETSD